MPPQTLVAIVRIVRVTLSTYYFKQCELGWNLQNLLGTYSVSPSRQLTTTTLPRSFVVRLSNTEFGQNYSSTNSLALRRYLYVNQESLDSSGQLRKALFFPPKYQVLHLRVRNYEYVSRILYSNYNELCSKNHPVTRSSGVKTFCNNVTNFHDSYYCEKV